MISKALAVLILLTTLTSVSFADGLSGTALINQCSGSLVILEGQDPIASQALLLTNGHCIERGTIDHDTRFPGLNEVFTHADIIDTDSATLLFDMSTTPIPGSNKVLKKVKKFPLSLVELVYATMTQTDIAIYKAKQTYAEIEQKTGIKPFVIARNPVLTPDTRITIPSSHWREVSTCQIDAAITGLRESVWTWGPSIRIKTPCELQEGASGSPLIIEASNLLVGILNTAYSGGEACTENNPCEIDSKGSIRVGASKQPYGQFLQNIYTCLDKDGGIDPRVPGCLLPKPITLTQPGLEKNLGKPSDTHLSSTTLKLDQLNLSEKKSIQDYTAMDFRYMNAGLRACIALENWQVKSVEVLMKALDKLPDYQGTVYRCEMDLPPQILARYQVGSVQLHQAFTSASTDSSYAGCKTSFVITSKHGKNIENYSASKAEHEVLFKAWTTFKVIRVEKIGERDVVYIEEGESSGVSLDAALSCISKKS